MRSAIVTLASAAVVAGGLFVGAGYVSAPTPTTPTISGDTTISALHRSSTRGNGVRTKSRCHCNRDYSN